MAHLPTLGLSPDDFVILLTHTPDYAEDVPITNTDLALAGHTRGRTGHFYLACTHQSFHPIMASVSAPD